VKGEMVKEVAGSKNKANSIESEMIKEFGYPKGETKSIESENDQRVI
jgi:hypothetical protein